MSKLKNFSMEVSDLIDKFEEGLIALKRTKNGLSEESIKGLSNLLKVAINQCVDKHLVMLYDSEKEQSEQLENQDGRALSESAKS